MELSQTYSIVHTVHVFLHQSVLSGFKFIFFLCSYFEAKPKKSKRLQIKLPSPKLSFDKTTKRPVETTAKGRVNHLLE